MSRKKRFLDEFAENVLAKGDVAASLQSMQQQGIQGQTGERIRGIQDLSQQLPDRRQEALDKNSLGSVLDEICQQLGDTVPPSVSARPVNRPSNCLGCQEI